MKWTGSLAILAVMALGVSAKRVGFHPHKETEAAWQPGGIRRAKEAAGAAYEAAERKKKTAAAAREKNQKAHQTQATTEQTTTESGLSEEDVHGFVSGQECPEKVYTDVVIIGAGMAGIQAAATLEKEGVSCIILEASARVGGRVRSHHMAKAGITVEDGANWVYDIPDNPIWELAQTLALESSFNDLDSVSIYDENGMPIDQDVYEKEVQRFRKAWDKAEGEADNQWTKDHASYQDNGLRSLLAEQGWTVGNDALGNLDYTIQWQYLDWEYAMNDTSVRYFPYDTQQFNGHVADMRGFEIIPQTLFATYVNRDSLRVLTRARQIHYNEWEVAGETTYRARVDTLNIQGCQTAYYGQRVINTVSVGVLNAGLTTFNPPLSYTRNPYHLSHYQKIFYHFETKFWDDTEFVRVVRDQEHRGHCHHWQSMDVAGKTYEGSAVIRCEIMTDAYQDLVGPDGCLTDETLLQLLDPLRLVYGPDVVGEPIDIYYPALNKDLNFGYGAYANWKPGFTFDDFAQFFGGTDLTGYCEHNGCNDIGEWVLILSGSASCYDFAETVHGAYFAGEKAANIVLNELGHNVDTDSRCDTNWVWLK